MTCEANGTKVGEIIEHLCEEGFHGITGAVITLLNEGQGCFGNQYCSAEYRRAFYWQKVLSCASCSRAVNDVIRQ